MAENGDTYDFFKIAYFIRNGDFLVDSKRMPFLSILISLFPEHLFIIWGRVLNNIFYVLSGLIFSYICMDFLNISKEKIKCFLLFLTIFLSNFVILDNSFFIMSDSLFLFLVLIIIYGVKKSWDSLIVTIIISLAFYTRIEGILIFLSYSLYLIFNKKYIDLIKSSVLFTFLLTPILYRNYINYSNLIYSGYFNDRAGFTFDLKNILKSFGSLFFCLGGFWFPVILFNNYKIITRLINLRLVRSFNFYLISFFLLLLLSWGFYIRLYSIPVVLSLTLFMYLYIIPDKSLLNINMGKKELFKPRLFIITLIFLFFYLINTQYLNHIDLAYSKFSKAVSILGSLLIIFLFNREVLTIRNIKIKTKGLLIGLIVFINVFTFTDKFIRTRYKYFTIVKASKFFIEKYPKDKIGYLDESGVQEWYLKDLNKKLSFLDSNMEFDDWLINEKISYIMYTQEMGYQDNRVKIHQSRIKDMEIIEEFKSPYTGGNTIIYKVN